MKGSQICHGSISTGAVLPNARTSWLGDATAAHARDQTGLTMMYGIVHHLFDIPAEMYLTPLTNNRTRLLIQANPDLFCRLQIQLLPQNGCAMKPASTSHSEPVNLEVFQNHTHLLSCLSHFNMFSTVNTCF